MSNSWWSRFVTQSYSFNFHSVNQARTQICNRLIIRIDSPFAKFPTYEMFIADPPALIQPIFIHQSLLLFCYFRRVRITRLSPDKPLSPSLMNKYGPRVWPGKWDPAVSDERCASAFWNLIDLWDQESITSDYVLRMILRYIRHSSSLLYYNFITYHLLGCD